MVTQGVSQSMLELVSTRGVEAERAGARVPKILWILAETENWNGVWEWIPF